MTYKSILSKKCRVRLSKSIVPLMLLLSIMSAEAEESLWKSTATRAYQLDHSQLKENLADDEVIHIVVSLKLRNRARLDATIKSLVTPGDPAYRHWLEPRQLRDEYAPTTEQAEAVADYLRKSGFNHVAIASNRLLITADGSAKAVRTAFNTQLGRVVEQGREGIANLQDVSVPASISGQIQAVLGLQTLDQVHTHIASPSSTPDAVTTNATGTAKPHSPLELASIYNVASLAPAKDTTVAIMTWGNMSQTLSDLNQFESQNNLPRVPVSVIQVGGASSDISAIDEWNMDSQSIVGVSGGLQKLIFYTAASAYTPDLTSAFNQAVIDNQAKVISASFGLCETTANSQGWVQSLDPILQTAMAQGQTVSVSTGDWGASECGKGVNGVTPGTQPGASYPASSPYVIAVGGTTLYTDANNNYASETVWSFTGGSPSLIEPKPSWQAGVVPGAYRGVPDIAFDGDPNSGVRFILNGVSTVNAGTSLSAPLFAGIWARLQSAHGNSLGFPAAWIYQYGASGHASGFHDVISGSNYGYSAAAGWDYASGFGSFDAAVVNSSVYGRQGWLPAVLNLLLDN